MTSEFLKSYPIIQTIDGNILDFGGFDITDKVKSLIEAKIASQNNATGDSKEEVVEIDESTGERIVLE